ncbi:MAG: RDD family protein [Bacilli bacterium]
MKIKYKRLLAYIVDILLVTFVVGLICNTSLMQKQMDKYNDANDRLIEKATSILESEEETTEETNEEIKSLVYDINYFGTAFNVVNVLVTIGYFAIFQCFNKGQTIGKKMMKIRIVSKDSQELPVVNYLFRAIILYGIAFIVINMVSIEFLKINGFYKVYSVSNAISSLISITIYFMILFRTDERGLHDILSSSKVIEE